MTTRNEKTKALFSLSLDGRAPSHTLPRLRGRAGVGALALAALFLAAPTAALADDECGAQVDSGNPESFDCPDASYGSGVTYATDGDLTLNFINADATPRSTIGGNGISLTGQGSDSVTVDSATTATELQNLGGMSGALLGVTTVDGSIDIDVDQMDADTFSASGVTHAISAESTGTGSIDIVTTGVIDANGSNPSTSIGLEAVTAGGDIAITTGSTVNAEQYGIRAAASGSGTLDITASGAASGGTAAIDATTGSGLLTIDIDGAGAGTIGLSSNTAIRTNAGGDATINVGSGRTVSNDNSSNEAVLDLTAAGITTVNNAGSIGRFGGLAIQASGGAFTLNNDGTVTGRLDFTDLDDGYVLNNNAGGFWRLGAQDSDLGGGIINNAGMIDMADSSHPVVSAPGTAYTGDGGMLEMSVFLDGIGQTSCSTATTASCLDLTGGSTAGETAIQIRANFTTLITGPLTAVTSANPGIVLVDVSGGTSQDEHFVLDPDSTLRLDLFTGVESVPVYATDPVYGAVLDLSLAGLKSILDYALLYDPGTQQHLLASVPSREGVEYVALIQEAVSIWHTTSDVVAGRQADLRDGATGRFWGRLMSSQSERDAEPTSTIHNNDFTYDQSYSLDTHAAIAGFDAISGENHVLGVHGGLVSSRLEFDDSSSRDETKGVTLGGYAGWWRDNGLTLDGTLNLNSLTVDHEPEGFEQSDIDILSLGIRAEAGWRLPLMNEALYVQPLATAAYVIADIDDVELRDNELGYEDARSLRGALGFRLGGELASGMARFDKFGYWLTARAWDEQSDEGEVQFEYRDGGHLAIEDDRSGSFEEVNFGVSASNADDTLSGYLSGGATFGDDVDTYNFSIGARLNW